MALINPTTGSTKFNVVLRREAVVSLAGDEPVILSESDEFSIKLVSDAISGEAITSRDLQEVPEEEIDVDGIWVKAAAAKLKNMSQEELIEMVLKLQAQTGVELPIEMAATEAAEQADAQDAEPEAAEETEPEDAEEKPKSRRRKKPKAEETAVEEPQAIDEVHTPAEDAEELDVEF